jgi:MFS family permease
MIDGERMVRKDTIVQIFADMDKQDAVAVLPATELVPVAALTASLKTVDGLFAVYNKKKNLVEIISEKKLEFSFGIPLWLFVSLTVVLGFFMSLGKAAVFKHIPVYYPNHVGSVGGIVGLIGGLGGFFLPITFGMMNDLIGVWTSCFMLLTVLIAIALIWMHFAIRRMEIQQYPELRHSKYLPELATDDESILAIIEGEALRQHSELLAQESGQMQERAAMLKKQSDELLAKSKTLNKT